VPEEVPTNPWNSDEEKKFPTHKTPNIPPPPHHGCAIPPPRERERERELMPCLHCTLYLRRIQILEHNRISNEEGNPKEEEEEEEEEEERVKNALLTCLTCCTAATGTTS
jgi:hypothetical protein